jgi:hypothetical protein
MCPYKCFINNNFGRNRQIFRDLCISIILPETTNKVNMMALSWKRH